MISKKLTSVRDKVIFSSFRFSLYSFDMKPVLVIFALLGLTVALPPREKRQAVGCLSAFLNVPNLCMNNMKGQVFFQHPTDPTKFLQCDINNRMYIVQCPQNEVFNVGLSACQPASVSTMVPPTRVPPLTTTIIPTTIRNFTPPQMAQQTPGLPQHPTPTMNPCTPGNLALGKLYFPFPGDKSRFYECDLKGVPTIRVCPPLLQWDQNILSCMYQANTSQPTGGNTSGQPKPTPQITAGNPTNPCTPQAISAGRFFFPHPDPTKYIQCDMWGDAFVNSCPPKLNWNAYLETCYTPFTG